MELDDKDKPKRSVLAIVTSAANSAGSFVAKHAPEKRWTTALCQGILSAKFVVLILLICAAFVLEEFSLSFGCKDGEKTCHVSVTTESNEDGNTMHRKFSYGSVPSTRRQARRERRKNQLDMDLESAETTVFEEQAPAAVDPAPAPAPKKEPVVVQDMAEAAAIAKKEERKKKEEQDKQKREEEDRKREEEARVEELKKQNEAAAAAAGATAAEEVKEEPPEPGPDDGGCAVGCSLRGTCEETTRLCNCIPPWGGADCTLPFEEDCEVVPGYTTPCAPNVPTTTGCLAKCKELGYGTIPPTYAFDMKPSGDLEKDCAAYKGAISKLNPGTDAPFKVQGSCLSGSCPPCSGNGFCADNKCKCFYGWSGEECGEPEPVYCINGCSGNGVCAHGVCKCNDGFRGADCSMTLEGKISRSGEYWSGAVARANKDGLDEGKYEGKLSTPKIFVYDLPSAINTFPLASLSSGNVPSDPSRPWEAHMPASAFADADGGWGSGALELILTEKFLTTPRRTLNGEEADYFFVPMWLSAPSAFVSPQDTLKDAVGLLTQFWPDWSKAADRHIFYLPGPFGACVKGGKLPEELKNSILLTHSGYLGGAIKSADVEGKCHAPGKHIVLPPLAKLDAALSPFFGGSLDKQTAVYWPIHATLEEDDKTFEGIAQAFESHADWKQGELTDADLAASKYCIITPGAGWDNRAVRAMLHACIPIFINGPTTGPFETDMFINYERISFRVASGADVAATVAAVVDEQYEGMLKELSCAVEYFTWSSASGAMGEEKATNDAWAGLMRVLTSRKEGQAAPNLESNCPSKPLFGLDLDLDDTESDKGHKYTCRAFGASLGYRPQRHGWADAEKNVRKGKMIDGGLTEPGSSVKITQGDKTMCDRAPGQPWWLSWPQGGALRS